MCEAVGGDKSMREFGGEGIQRSGGICEIFFGECAEFGVEVAVREERLEFVDFVERGGVGF